MSNSNEVFRVSRTIVMNSLCLLKRNNLITPYAINSRAATANGLWLARELGSRFSISQIEATMYTNHRHDDVECRSINPSHSSRGENLMLEIYRHESEFYDEILQPTLLLN